MPQPRAKPKKKTAARRRPRKTPLERVFSLIDAEVEKRARAVLAELDHTERIVELVNEARGLEGANMRDLARRVKRVDRRTRELRPITRQALDLMLSNKKSDTDRADARARRSRERAEEMHAYNADGHSLTETAEHFGVTPQTVSQTLSSHGLPVYDWRRRASGYVNADALA